MPIALLIQETVYTFRWGAYHLEPWNMLVRTEETIVDRARTAFLVRWFGTGLPIENASLRIAIENAAALRERYFAVTRSVSESPAGPNITEPLAGLVGQLAGIALSPAGFIALTAYFLRHAPGWLRVFGSTLVGSILGAIAGAVGTVVGGAVFAPAIGAALVAGLAEPPALVAMYALVGEVSRAIVAAVRFFNLLLGPREAIHNPLLKALLELFDHLADLVPAVLGFAALIVTRVGPLLEPLAKQIGPFRDLISEVGTTLHAIFDSLHDSIAAALTSARDPVSFALEQLGMLFPVLGIVLTALFADLGDRLAGRLHLASLRTEDWLGTVENDLIALFHDHPLVQRFRAAQTIIAIASRLAPASSGSSSPSTMPSFPALPSAASVITGMGGAPAGGFGAIGTLARIDAKYNGALFEDSLSPAAGVTEALAKTRRPRSLFAEERADLVRVYGEPKAALADLRGSQLQLRESMIAVVERVLPPAMQAMKGQLIDVFSELDDKLFEVRAKAALPVKDLPDNGMLRPVVRQLVLRSSGGERGDLEAFRTRLVAALGTQNYPVPAQA